MESESGSNVTEENGLQNNAMAMQAETKTVPQDCVIQNEMSNYCEEIKDRETPEGNVNSQLYVDKTMTPKSEGKGASVVNIKAEKPESSNSVKHSEVKVESDKNGKDIKASFKTTYTTAPKKKEMKRGRKSRRQQQGQKLTSGSTAAFLSASRDSSNSEFSDDARTGGKKATPKLFLMGPARDAYYLHGNREKKSEDPKGNGPFFYIGGCNGAAIVSAYLVQKGWQRIYDNNRHDYKLRWCETKSMAAYNTFRGGEQLIYQIPNNKVLTTKIGLLSSLREYERVINRVRIGTATKLLKLEDFFPETYRMDIKEEREHFFAIYKEKQVWICKPTGLNQGRGIFLLKCADDVIDFRADLQRIADNPVYKKQPYKSPQARIMQRYIHNPLLLEGKKFDIRSYFLIACTMPYVVFFRHGYVRLTCSLYDPSSDDLTAHLTNQYMQKKNPLYNELKEETVWSMERFNKYINEKFTAAENLPKDWVFTVFTKRMQQIMMQCFLAVKSKLDCKLGYFDLIGCDFLIDKDFKVWFLEMNCNPALHTNCDILKEVIPSVVNETLDLTLEIFNKRRKGMKIMPLQSLSSFVLLHNGDLNDQTEKSPRARTPAVKTPQKMQRCKSAVLQGPVSSKVTEKIRKTASSAENPRRGVLPFTSSSVTKISDRTVLSMSQRHMSLEPNLNVPYTMKLKVSNELPFSGRSARQNTDGPVFAEHKPDSSINVPKNMTTMSVPSLNERYYLRPQLQIAAGYRTQSTANTSLNSYLKNSSQIRPLHLQTRTSVQRMKRYKANKSISDGRESVCDETEARISDSEIGESVITAKADKNVSFVEGTLKLSDDSKQHKSPSSDRGA